MHVLAAILALLTGAAGWHYLFYSSAAHRLAGLEETHTNRRRIVLRRANGVAMLLLAICFFMLFWTVTRSGALLLVLAAVLLLLITILILALIDLRLTWRLRHKPPASGKREPPETH
jgi:hypothetical protein